MTSTRREPFTQCADVCRTKRFLSVEPLSGYIRFLCENNSFVIYLSPEANDQELGRALLEALDRSRFIWPDDEREFFDSERNRQCYRNWQQEVMRRYGYKTKRDLYENMDWCRVERSERKITIQPHKRDKPEYFTDFPRERDVIISETRDAATAGAALRLALDRCE